MLQGPTPAATGHSSGKVILLGEHAVVYGVPALAVGIDRGATAQATTAAESSIELGTLTARPGDGSEAGAAFEALLSALAAPRVSVRVQTAVPTGVGLGASAAIAVAVARAVIGLRDADPSPTETPERTRQVLDAALAWEGIFHGNPSGVDTAAATYGGCIRFVRGQGIKPVRVTRPLTLAVALAGPPASTKLMVDSVARHRERNPDVFEKTLEAIRALVENAQLALEHGDHAALGKFLDLNQMLLAGWFLSTERIEEACRLARDAGALGAKLTGSGGGGAVIALVDGDPAPIAEAWQTHGIDSFVAHVGAPEETS